MNPPSTKSATSALALQLFLQGRAQDAERMAASVIAREPKNIEAYQVLALALAEQHQAERAREVLGRAAAIAPNDHFVQHNYGSTLRESGRAEQATDSFRRALALKPDYEIAWSSFLYNMMFDPRFTPQAVADARKTWGESACQRVPAREKRVIDRTPDRRLRIGYCSPHFHKHSVSAFVSPILENHDRDKVETFCYSDGRKHDETTARLKASAHHWRDSRAMSHEELASAIAADAIDILVDLAGHMGSRRLPTFALKPAPVQVSYIGDQATTGLPTMDWRITDEIADPPGVEAMYTEKLWRISPAFFAYRPWDGFPDVPPLPANSAGHVMFGYFNHTAKLSPWAIGIWSQLLRRVPDSRLLMLVRDADPRRHWVLDEFERNGIATLRIELMPQNFDRAHYLRTVASADIALDAIPFTGHTTTCDALWMGVPVITLAGDAYWKRMSASVLTNLAATELIAQSPQQYVDIAATLANDRGRLGAYRQDLRSRLRSSLMTSGPAFTASLEQAYQSMWKQFVEGVPVSSGVSDR